MGEYKDLLDEIKSSNRETFKEIDFKKYMRNDEYVDLIIEWDEEKLEEQIKKKSQKRTLASKLERLEEHKVIFREKNISLSFSDSTSDPLNNLKNWLRYRIIGSLRKCYFSKTYDCDVCYKRIVSELEIPWDNEYVDNIFSVATLFFEFIRTFLYKHQDEIASETNLNVNKRKILEFFYKKEFGIRNYRKKSYEYRDAWILMNIDKLYKIALENEKEVFDAFNKLCKYTHTFGNYMPCPDSKYNRIKGAAKHKDNIYHLRKETKQYNKWFVENEFKYNLDILLKKDNMILPKEYTDKDLSKYLEDCSEVIQERSGAIFESKKNVYNFSFL